jgi:tellurite resistance protein TerC
MDMFVYLKTGISFILTFVGMKMIISDYYPIPIHISLMVIVAVLAIAVIASVTIGKKRHPHF